MFAFFTPHDGPVQEVQNLDAVDLVGGSYVVRIRKTGILVIDCNKMDEPKLDLELNLCDLKPEKDKECPRKEPINTQKPVESEDPNVSPVSTSKPGQ